MPDRGFLPSDAPSLRAVLVDDEPAATSWVAELLNRHPYVEVVGTAEDATTAERLLDQLRPDVVFVDVQMPRRSGLTVLAFLVPGRRVAREPPAASGREGVSVASGGGRGAVRHPPMRVSYFAAGQVPRHAAGLALWETGGFAGFLYRVELPPSSPADTIPQMSAANLLSLQPSGPGPASYSDPTSSFSTGVYSQWTIEASDRPVGVGTPQKFVGRRLGVRAGIR